MLNNYRQEIHAIAVLQKKKLLKWLLLVDEGRKTGHTFSQPDLMIAATAIHHGLTVVTRDRNEFDKARVPVVNHWDGQIEIPGLPPLH